MRYTVPMGDAKVYGQVNGSYQSSASSDLRTDFADAIGRLPAYGTVNLAFGADWDKLSFELFASNLFDERGEVSRFIQCGACTQRPYVVTITPRTLGVRLGAKF
jgi:hypothetical protein